MKVLQTSFLRKMTHTLFPVSGNKILQRFAYRLGEVDLSSLVGQNLILEFSGKIECVHCGRSIKKTFQDGYCYPCFLKLAACDMCILKPERCHYRQGTCREPEWGEKHCLIPHIVYLSNTTGLKVGITRAHKTFERWGDQGAVSAIVFAKVPERYVAGLFEVALRDHISDKTDWRALLKGVLTEIDLVSERARLRQFISPELQKYLVSDEEEASALHFEYPIQSYLSKALTHNPEKESRIEGELHGMRGQYVFIGDKALNIRKYTGYEVTLGV